MFGIGTGEMALIAAIAIVVIGPDKLPQFMRMLGRYYGQIRRAADDLRRAFVLEADRQDASERYKALQERRKSQQEARRKAQEESGGAAQPAEIAATPPADPPPTGDPSTEVVPNDIPPDSPHPSLTAPRVEAPVDEEVH